MPNLKELEKSRGVVVFAFNTSVDYVKIADRTSRLTKHTLGLPITLITDLNSEPDFSYDTVIRINPQGNTFRLNDAKEEISWRNFGRYLAYELSPYDETLLLDTDYVVLDDSLLKIFDTEFDYKLMRHNSTQDGPSYEEMGETSLPFVWATVVAFRKTHKTDLFFNLIGRVQRNYSYYRALYNIREGNYRNDYAFAIADNIVNGYTTEEDQGIPWRMFTIDKPIGSMALQGVLGNRIAVYLEESALLVPIQNIHVMDKEFLLSDSFEYTVRTICEPT